VDAYDASQESYSHEMIMTLPFVPSGRAPQGKLLEQPMGITLAEAVTGSAGHEVAQDLSIHRFGYMRENCSPRRRRAGDTQCP
jgi:hypothetical protein